jgi:hypothetical protein
MAILGGKRSRGRKGPKKSGKGINSRVGGKRRGASKKSKKSKKSRKSRKSKMM